MFQRDDWTLFRTLGTIGQKAGVSTDDLPRLVAKELADNALDASGGCRVDLLDDGENGFHVEDDGPGIPGSDADIAALFSIGRPLISSKQIRLPSRGALGNGLRVVAGAVLASGGSLIVSTGGRTLRLTPRDSGETQHEVLGPYDRPGTRVEVRLGRELAVTWSSLDWANEAMLMASPDAGRRYAGKTSPWWYDSDSFFNLLDASTTQTVADLVEMFDGFTGGKGLRVARTFGKGRLAHSLDRDEAEALLATLREQGNAKPFNPGRLGGVGTIDALPPCYAKASGTFSLRAGRGELHATIPLVAEVWIEDSEEPAVQVCVNRTPVADDAWADHGKNEQPIEVGGLFFRLKVGKRPRRIWINVETPFMPITTDGKSPDFGPIAEVVKAALTKAVKRSRRALAVRRDESSPCQKGIILTHLQAAIDKAGGDGRYRYSLRQLFYAIRPYIITALGVELNYKYFGEVITEYEGQLGCDLPGIVRDTRGILYHPHEKKEIPLGTLAVEIYRRPDWTFNKVLYCEKEGFFPMLQHIGWPERNDCALLTSKGFATRAARDVIDLLGDTDEELTFFCIHDADAPGTMIYQSLQEATKARPARRVKIINLGLDPAEALAMGLSVEAVTRKDASKKVPVADYLTNTKWRSWLQLNRVELNAMPTPQLVEWIDRKFAPHAGKVIPPPEVLEDQLACDIQGQLRAAIIDRVLSEADIDGQVEAAIKKLHKRITERAGTIRADVLESLQTQPTELWKAPVARVAASIVKGGSVVGV